MNASLECTSGALSGARLAFVGRAPINARPGRPCTTERAQPGSVKRGGNVCVAALVLLLFLVI